MSLKTRLAKLEARHDSPDYNRWSLAQIDARIAELWAKASESERAEFTAMMTENGFTLENGVWRHRYVP
jgi:hypothetical protein